MLHVFIFVALSKNRTESKEFIVYLVDFVAPMSRIFMRTEKCSCIQYFVQYMCIPYTHTYGIHFGFVYVFFLSFCYSSFHGISFRFIFFFFQYTIYVVQEWKGEQKKILEKIYTFFYTRSFIQFQMRSAILIPQLSSAAFFKMSVFFHFICAFSHLVFVFVCVVDFFEKKKLFRLRLFIHLFCSPQLE